MLTLNDEQKNLVRQPVIHWNDRYEEGGSLSGKIYFKLDCILDHHLLEPAEIGIHAKYISRDKVAVEGHKGKIGAIGEFEAVLNDLLSDMKESYGVSISMSWSQLLEEVKKSVRERMEASVIIFK